MALRAFGSRALPRTGNYEVAVPAAHVLPIPTGLIVIEASVLPEAACTVYFNLSAFAAEPDGTEITSTPGWKRAPEHPTE